MIILKKFGLKNFIYMGDGFYDAKILKECCFGISPKMQELRQEKIQITLHHQKVERAPFLTLA